MDTLIRRGMLIDGTGGAKRRADVLVQDGLIHSIEPPESVDPDQAKPVTGLPLGI